MRRTVVLLVVLGLLAIAPAALAGPDHDSSLPEHPHVLVLGVEFDETGEPVGVRKCIDLAANQELPLRAHHSHVHFGPAGEALFDHAGHIVAPTAPFPGVPWTDCESLLAFFGF